MNNYDLRNILDNAKLSLDCRDFLNLHCSEGHSISAPQFIRSDDRNPSFAVYKDHCFDFATNQVFDIFDLKMLRDGQDLPSAFLDLTGQKLFPDHFDHQSAMPVDSAKINLDNLNHQVSQWNSALLADPIITFNGKNIHLLSEYLAGRGITPDTCKHLMLGFDISRNRLMFPCFKNGHPVAWCGRELSGSSLPKYLKPKLDADENFGLEIVPWGLNTLRDPHKKSTRSQLGDDGSEFDEEYDNPKDYTLVIVEGACDWASFAQEGWQVISPMGGHFRKSLYPFIINLAKNYKQVLLCFDNDKAGQSFQLKMARLFFEHRIKFICGHTKNPDGSDSKFDVNDYYSHGGSLDLLVKQATPGLVDYANSFDSLQDIADMLEQAARFASPLDMSTLRTALMKRVIPNPDFNPEDKASDPFIPEFDPFVLKDIFRDAKAIRPELAVADEVLAKHKIIYNYNDSFYYYKSGRWQAAAEAEILGFILKILGRKATNGKARAIMKDLQSIAGQWAKFDNQHVIAFTNGVLDLETGKFSKHSPDFMNTIKLNYAYSKIALCPRWSKFIHEVSKGNKQIIRQLQKAVGYILFADNSLQKMFALFGTGANGKSVFTGVVEQVFGSENTSHVRLDSLCSPFEAIHLNGKMLNISYENKRGLNGAEDILKAVVSGDPIMSAHKGVDSVSFTSRAKWFVNLNDVLETTDISWGFLRRLIFIPFNAHFDGNNADPHLMDTLLKELPGIFNWAYEGYKILREDMSFEELEEATKLLEQMMQHVNSSFAFFCEAFKDNAANFLKEGTETHRYPTSAEIYQYYKDWCKDNNEKPENKRIFLERFNTALLRYRPDVVISEPYHEDGVRGKVVKYYFPEILPDMEPDFFAERRDPDTGEFIDLSEPVTMTDEQFMEQNQRIDLFGSLEDVEERQSVTKGFQPETEEAKQRHEDYMCEEGAKIYGRCLRDKDNWWKPYLPAYRSLTSFQWVALAYYLRRHPSSIDSIDFTKHYLEFLAGQEGTTSAQ